MFGRRHHGDTLVEDRPGEVREDHNHDDIVVVERPVAPAGPVTVEEERVSARTAPGQLLSIAAGIFFLVVGILTVVRGGLGGAVDKPLVDVLGFTRTPLVGILEIAGGALLVLAGMTFKGKLIAIPVATAMLVCGILVLAEPGRVPDELRITDRYGWLLTIMGGALLLGFVALPFTAITRRRAVPYPS